MERIQIKIKANSKINEIVSQGVIWEVKIKKPARENKANLELVKFLSKELKKKVKIVSGMKSKIKVLEVY